MKRFSSRSVPALGLLITLSMALGCTRADDSATLSKEGANRAANFELQSVAGNTVRLSDYQGKVVLLDFWATYCIPCHESIPAFQQLQDQFKGQGFEVLGISVDAFTKHVPEYVAENDMRYVVLLDPEENAQSAYGIRGLPETFLIGRDGEIKDHWIGYDGEIGVQIQAAVQAALRGPEAS